MGPLKEGEDIVLLFELGSGYLFEFWFQDDEFLPN
jgi:hypothetical protein